MTHHVFSYQCYTFRSFKDIALGSITLFDLLLLFFSKICKKIFKLTIKLTFILYSIFRGHSFIDNGYSCSISNSLLDLIGINI